MFVIGKWWGRSWRSKLCERLLDYTSLHPLSLCKAGSGIRGGEIDTICRKMVTPEIQMVSFGLFKLEDCYNNNFHKTSRFLSCRSKCLKVALEGKIWNLCVWKMRRWHLLHSGKAIKVLQSVPQNVTFWKMRQGHLLHSCHFIWEM